MTAAVSALRALTIKPKQLLSLLAVLALAFNPVMPLVSLMPVQAASNSFVTYGLTEAEGSMAIATNSDAHNGLGSWQNDQSEDKTFFYIPTNELSDFTVADIKNLSFATKKLPDDIDGNDFYATIYTEADDTNDDGWYGRQINIDPIYSSEYNSSSTSWEVWNTTDAGNTATVYDPNNSAYGWYDSGSNSTAQLEDLQNGNVDWNDYLSTASSTSINYSDETVSLIAFSTGSGWNSNFSGLLDSLSVELNDGSTLEVDLEPTGPVYRADGSGDPEEYFDTIQAAIDDSDGVGGGDGSTNDDDTIVIAQNISEGLVTVNKDVAIQGDGGAKPVISPAAATSFGGNWFTVTDGTAANFNNLVFDGAANSVFFALMSHGTTIVDNVDFKNIKQGTYYGFGVSGLGGTVNGGGGGNYAASDLTVSNSTFDNIGRVGVFVKGDNSVASVSDITYTGKGNVDGVDYGVEFSGGATGSVAGSTITGNRGVASDGSTSAGLYASTFHGAGTDVAFTNNNLSNNTSAIAVGYGNDDTSSVVANQNNITGNDNGVFATASSNNVDVAENWWGDTSGPGGEGPGGGDSVDANTDDYDPWLCGPFETSPMTTVDGNCLEAPTDLRLYTNNTQTAENELACGGATNVAAVMKAWSDESASGAVEYDYNVTGDKVPGGSWTTTVGDNQKSGGGHPFGNGEYTFKVRSVNSEGQTSEWSEACAYIFDNEAPVVELTAPTDGSALSGSVDVEGEVTDNIDLSHYNLSLYPSTTDLADGETHSSDRINSQVGWGDGTVDTDSPASVLRTLDSTQLSADGDYQLRLAARDEAGNRDTTNYDSAPNSSIHVVSFTVDNSAPTMNNIKMFVNGEESRLVKSGDTVRVTAHATDPSNVDKIQFWFRNADTTTQLLHTGYMTDEGGGEYSLEFEAPANYDGGEAINETSDGNYFVFRPYDELGNKEIHRPTEYFTIDNTAPDVQITSTTDNGDGTYTVSGTVDDGSPVSVTVNGGPATVVQTGNDWSVTTSELAEGSSNDVVATATDDAGNTTDPAASDTIEVEEDEEASTGVLAVTSENDSNPGATPLQQFAVLTPGGEQAQVGGEVESTTDDNTDTSDEDGDTLQATDDGNDSEDEESSADDSLPWWWWLLIIAALGGGLWLVAARRSRNE